MANYSQIRKMDISNGEGIGVSIFFSGCHFHCKGCFNWELWDYNHGKPFTQETIDEIIQLMKKDYIVRLSILGGEPMDKENIEATYDLVKQVKIKYPKKKIWLYTGYTIGQLAKRWNDGEKTIGYILYCVDNIVDGQYDESLKDMNLKFRGSSNQHIWHIVGVNFNRPQESNDVIKHHILINPNKENILINPNKENMQLTLDEFCDTIKWQPINYDKLMERKDKI